MLRKLLIAVAATATLLGGAVAFASVKPAGFKPTRHGNVVQAPKTYKGHQIQHYAWERCKAKKCAKIARATYRKYDLRKADRGAKLRVLITFKEHGQAVILASGDLTIPSVPTPPIAPPDPVNVSAPVLSGTAEQGETLTGTQGTWQNAVSFNDQWEDCDASGANCTPIAGATGLSYVLQASDVGHTIVLSVTAFNTSQGQTQAQTGDLQVG